MKKTRQPILFALCSGFSCATDLGLFYLLRVLLGGLGPYAELICTWGARAASSFLNFNLNNRLVFGNRSHYGQALLRYYCLAVPQAAASALLLLLFVQLLHVETAEGSTLTKLVVDSCLFVISFFIQKFWVFSRKKEESTTNS